MLKLVYRIFKYGLSHHVLGIKPVWDIEDGEPDALQVKLLVLKLGTSCI